MGGRTHEVLVTLQRNSPQIPWGFSLVGGADVNTPLIVTKVGFGSPADGVLQRGDIITKVGNYDARDIRHQDAQHLFRNAGSNVKVVVQRENPSRLNTSTASSRASSHNYSPLSVSPHLSPRGGNLPTSPGAYSPAGSALTPVYTAPFTAIDDNYFYVHELGGKRNRGKGEEGNLDVHVTKQPYRTTPLVLPGAKVKHEPGITESYLRHHPNPAVRAHPHALDTDHLYKQKVANSVLERISTGDPNKQVVHKQFNSPIGLYSDSAIADTLQKQTGVAPVRKNVKFNPAESEAYKALQEEQLGDVVQEVPVPPMSKVFTPNKTTPASKGYQKPATVIVNQSNSEPEVIHQSNSFKRLMWSVMSESSY